MGLFVGFVVSVNGTVSEEQFFKEFGKIQIVYIQQTLFGPLIEESDQPFNGRLDRLYFPPQEH